ncbi:MAG TPA: fumarylacetoacetate hydrolase family protein [Acidimicrobiales bacterium]|nr:fumarylacetoacetate hydrolase family protein [Acidimicrobiales bacterium]
MKIARIDLDGSERLARIDGDQAHPLAVDVSSPFAVLLADATTLPHTGHEPVALDRVGLLAPIARPGSVIAVGLNYADHARESGMDEPATPITFPKLPQSVIGPDAVIRWSPSQSTQVDYEAELAVIIAADVRDVAVGDALGHVLGYTCCNDVSARDAQFSDGQWLRSKSFDTFCPLGPWLVTPDDLPDPQSLAVACRVNGTTLQESTTAEMIHGVADIISYLSRFFTLRAGDVITTGTPAGVGFARTPPIFLGDGDVVEIEIDGIGVLRNACVVG